MKKSPLKIAFVIDALRVGGAERMLLSLVSTLPKDRFSCQVYTIVEQGHLASAFIQRGIPLIQIGKRGKFSWGTIARLRAAWKVWTPDMVHTHLFAGDTYGRLAAWRSGIPVVTTEHNMNLDEGGVKRWIRRLLSHVSVRIIAVSQAVKDYSVHQEHIASQKIQVIYNGVDGRQFSPRPVTRHEVPVIGMTSRLHINKGHVYLLEALSELRHLSWTVDIAGDGLHKAFLLEKAKEFGIDERIHWLGQVSDVPGVLSGIDIMVLPTIQEGFGFSVVEAMLMEKPVVAFQTGPLPEIVVDGKTGVLVETKNIQALRSAIQELLESPELRQFLGQAGRQRALHLFTLERMVQEYIKVYEDITGQ